MMINNHNVMGQQVPLVSQQGQPQTQPQPVPSQMMPTGAIVNPAMTVQARQGQNDDILSNCLMHTQRLRESLEILLNSTKQAAVIENDEGTLASSSSSSSSSVSAATAAAAGVAGGGGGAAAAATGATTTATSASSTATSGPSANNAITNPANSTIKQTIDRRLFDMSTSLDQLGQLLDQFDFKILNQQGGSNPYNELSFEKQGTLVDEWSSNMRWMNKIGEIFPAIQLAMQTTRRATARNMSLTNRTRIDAPSSANIERLIAQVDQSASSLTSNGQQLQAPMKEYSISYQRLSDHLSIVEYNLNRSGLTIYLYLRHCSVEHVVIKPLNEKRQFGNHFQSKPLTNYHSLQIIAGHIRAAAVFFASSTSQPDQSLQKLFVYISKYNTLPSQKCMSCQKHLLNGLPPTWRDFKTYECYHEECLN
jgi:hypothetical protein